MNAEKQFQQMTLGPEGERTFGSEISGVTALEAMERQIRFDMDMTAAPLEEVVFAYTDELASSCLPENEEELELDVEQLARPDDVLVIDPESDEDGATLADLIEKVGGHFVIENRWRRGEGKVGIAYQGRFTDN